MEFENICSECSESFVSTDEEATICPECWKKIVGENEGAGSDEG